MTNPESLPKQPTTAIDLFVDVWKSNTKKLEPKWFYSFLVQVSEIHPKNKSFIFVLNICDTYLTSSSVSLIGYAVVARWGSTCCNWNMEAVLLLYLPDIGSSTLAPRTDYHELQFSSVICRKPCYSVEVRTTALFCCRLRYHWLCLPSTRISGWRAILRGTLYRLKKCVWVVLTKQKVKVTVVRRRGLCLQRIDPLVLFIILIIIFVCGSHM